MKNSKVLFQETEHSIIIRESKEEIQSIVYLVLANLLNLTRTEIIAGKMITYSDTSMRKMKEMIQRINNHEPVQYVLGEEFFFGRRFQVNPSVLIPRPETEELVRVVLAYKNLIFQRDNVNAALKILDIGTGSGCIPITLFHEIYNAEIYATDVSKAALAIAAHNAKNLLAKINWIEHDILTEKIPVGNLDIIVSNPPYVTKKEMGELAQNIVDYEPHLALLVSDEDPLIFYNVIVQQSGEVLRNNGLLAVEINERFGNEVTQLFLQAGFQEVKTMKDMAGKERVVCGLRGSQVIIPYVI